MSCNLEIVEFARPDINRKNLYITPIPCLQEEDILNTLYQIFSSYGLIYGIQLYPTQVKNFKYVLEPDTLCTDHWQNEERLQAEVKSSDREGSPPPAPQQTNTGYYAFVNYYLAMAARRAKEVLHNRIVIKGVECKIAYAKRKKEKNALVSTLHFIKCQELANYYLGFNGWSSAVKLMNCDSEITDGEIRKLRYVCIIDLTITSHGLHSEGMGAWEESYCVTDPTSRAKAVCKCKKLSYQRSVENAFSKVILVVLANGKVTVEVDTTKPDVMISSDKQYSDDPVIKVNELDEEPEDEVSSETEINADDTDAANLHILHMLEEEEDM